MVVLKDKIHYLLQKNSITHKKFCIDIGISDAGMRKIYTRNSMELFLLQKISDYFKVPISYFTDEAAGSNNITVGHDANNINSNVTITKLIDEMAAQRKSYEEQMKAQREQMKAQCEQHDQHINRLLNILEERLPK